jgi:hypothetical protein
VSDTDKPVAALQVALRSVDSYAVYCQCGKPLTVAEAAIEHDGTVALHVDRCQCKPEEDPT